MSETQLLIDYILKGYSNRYINLLLDMDVDRIEFYRNYVKEQKAFYEDENIKRELLGYGNE